MEGIFFY